MTRDRAVLLAARFTADAEAVASSPDRLGAAIAASHAQLATRAAGELGASNRDIRTPARTRHAN